MRETIKRLYIEGRLTVAGVEKAVAKGWITRGEADRILLTGAERAHDSGSALNKGA